jgi:hypothetical protein
MRAASMHALYPAAADSVDQTYQDGSYEVLSASLHTSIAIPNRVIYVDKVPDTGADRSTHKGTANDSDSQGRVGVIVQIFTPDAPTDIGNNISGGNNPIAGDNEAQQRADTILQSIQHEASEGIFTTHPNTALEMWDKVSVIENISGVTTGGRVGRIETIWDATGLAASGSRYIQNVELGGLVIRASNLAYYVSAAALSTIREEVSQLFPDPLVVPDILTEHAGFTDRSAIGTGVRPDRVFQINENLSEEFPWITVDPPKLPFESLERDISPELAASMSNFRPPTNLEEIRMAAIISDFGRPIPAQPRQSRPRPPTPVDPRTGRPFR